MECIFNPDSRRCVLKNGSVGKKVIAKYGNQQDTLCFYNTKTKKCNLKSEHKKTKMAPPLIPQVYPVSIRPPPTSPASIKTITPRLSPILRSDPFSASTRSSRSASIPSLSSRSRTYSTRLSPMLRDDPFSASASSYGIESVPILPSSASSRRSSVPSLSPRSASSRSSSLPRSARSSVKSQQFFDDVSFVVPSSVSSRSSSVPRSARSSVKSPKFFDDVSFVVPSSVSSRSSSVPRSARSSVKSQQFFDDVSFDLKKFNKSSLDQIFNVIDTPQYSQSAPGVIYDKPSLSPNLSNRVSRVSAPVQPSSYAEEKMSKLLKNVTSSRCDIFDILTANGIRINTVEALPSNSASDSIIIKITTDKNISIIMKTSFQDDIKKDNLFLETFIYKFIDKFKLPFVVNYVKNFTCKKPSDFISTFSEEIQERYYRLYQRLFTTTPIREMNKNMNILLTEMCGNNCQTLTKFLEGNHPKSTLYSIFLQLLFTLSFFQEIGLQHNDLHPGNILIENKQCNIKIKVNKDIQFNFATEYIVRIYDYDQAVIVPTSYNYKTSYKNPLFTKFSREVLCLNNNINNGIRDTAQVFWWLHTRLGNKMPPLLLEIMSLMGPLNYFYYGIADFEKLQKVWLSGLLPKLAGTTYIPWQGFPCKVYTNDFELIKDFKTPLHIFKSMSQAILNDLNNGLRKPIEGLQELSSVLPSASTNCKQYTSLKECMTPNKKGLTTEQKRKFRENILRISKNI